MTRRIEITEPVRLIVADIDGCLNAGNSDPYSPRLLAKLQKTNTASRTDPDVPAITFCTGRPQPYVECLIQATHGHKPALCEGGAVLFDPATHSVQTHRLFGASEAEMLHELRRELTREVIGPSVVFEPGKVTHITLIVLPPRTPSELLDDAQRIAARFGDTFVVETTRVCVHILFRNLHKGTGIDWLSDHTGVAPTAMAGIGDARPDIPFLQMMNVAFAPANAHPDVKRVCRVVSRRQHEGAMRELVDAVVAANRALGLEPLEIAEDTP